MLIHTVLDLEKVLKKDVEVREKTQVSVGSAVMVLKQRGEHYYIDRLLSTNPNDYLLEPLQPGRQVY